MVNNNLLVEIQETYQEGLLTKLLLYNYLDN